MRDTATRPTRHGRARTGWLQAKALRSAAALALAVAGGSLIGAGAFVSWDASASALSAGPTGGVRLTDVSESTFTDAVAGLLPGDYLYRYLDVTNDGGQPSTFTGAVTVTGDLAGQLSVDAVSCSVPWATEAGASTCTGTTSPSRGAGIPTATVPLGIDHGMIATGTGNAQHVRYTFTLLRTAPSSTQGTTGAVDIAVSDTVIGGSAPAAG